MDNIYMTRLGSAFIEELTSMRKLAAEIPAATPAAVPGMFARGRQFMGEGFGHLGNIVGGQGPMAQRMGAPVGTGLWQHMKNVFEGGKIPEIGNVAGKAGEAAKTIIRGGGLLGGLKAVAKTPLGKAGLAGAAVLGAGGLLHKAFSRPNAQPMMYQ